MDKEITCISLLPPKNRETFALISNFISNLILFVAMVFLANCLVERANRCPKKRETSKSSWIEFIYRERPKRIYTKETPPSTVHHNHNLTSQEPYTPSPSGLTSVTQFESEIHNKTRTDLGVDLRPLTSDDVEVGKLTVEDDELESFLPDMLEACDTASNGKDDDANEPETKARAVNPFPTKPQMQFLRKLQSCLVYYDDSLLSKTKSEKFIAPQVEPEVHNFSVLSLLSLSDELIKNRRGEDAIKYLRFLRQLIWFLGALSFLCVLVVLPINLLGTRIENRPENLFRRTTIQNIRPGSFSFWWHISISSMVMPIAVCIFHFYGDLAKADSVYRSSRTLLIRDSSMTSAVRKNIFEYLAQFVKDPRRIEGIQLVYDCRNLFRFKNLFINYHKAWAYCREYLVEHQESFEVRPYFFGQWLGLIGCCNQFPKTHGYTHYSKLKWHAARSLLKDYGETLGAPKASFFVTFSSDDVAKRVYNLLKIDFFRRQAYKLNLGWTLKWRKLDHYDFKGMQPWLWDVSFASNPSDIDWLALVRDTRWLQIRELTLNVILFVIFFFATTPFFLSPYLGVIPKILEGFGLNRTANDTIIFPTWNYSLIEENIRSFCLLLVQQILPIVVTMFSSWVPHYLKSEQNFAITWRVYSFFLCMILIIPSLGTSSIHEWFRSFLSKEKFSWYCLFYVYDYSFFIVYVIQSAFIANGIRLLRVSKIIAYFFFMHIWAPGSPEFETAQRRVSFEFVFGYEYASLLFIFTIISVYSIACPLIAPCGLVFLCCKYLVDRFNIYHAFSPSVNTYKIQRRAVSIVYSSIFMMQFHILSVVYTQHAPTTVFGFGSCIFLISFLGLMLLVFVDSTPRYLRKPETAQKVKHREKKNWCCCNYLPALLALLGMAVVPTDHNRSVT